jgi:hypothetical protein
MLYGVSSNVCCVFTRAGKKASKNAVKIAVPVIAGVLLLTSFFFVWFFRGRVKFSTFLPWTLNIVMLNHSDEMLTSHDINFTEKKKKTKSQKKQMPVSVNTSTEIVEGDHTEDLEFPLIQFADIIAATGNFSKTFMIGRGGFGKVYKVLVSVRWHSVAAASNFDPQNITYMISLHMRIASF